MTEETFGSGPLDPQADGGMSSSWDPELPDDENFENDDLLLDALARGEGVPGDDLGSLLSAWTKPINEDAMAAAGAFNIAAIEAKAALLAAGAAGAAAGAAMTSAGGALVRRKKTPPIPTKASA